MPPRAAESKYFSEAHGLGKMISICFAAERRNQGGVAPLEPLWRGKTECDLMRRLEGRPFGLRFFDGGKRYKKGGFGHNYHKWQIAEKISDSHENFSKRL